MYRLFLAALVLSLIFCATPGAVNTQALRVGVTGGFRRAFGVEMGSIVGDMSWAVIALAGLAAVWDNDAARTVLSIVGASFLLYLAYQGFQDARRKEIAEVDAPKGHTDFVTGVIMSFANPFQIPFWIGIGSTSIAVIMSDPGLMDFAVFYLGYLVGAIIWGTAYSALIGYGKRYITPKLFRALSVICALVLLYFALNLLYSTFLNG
ncbi:MAG TPA: LysE family transporter [Methanomassiliicoccales archaeon]|nr:LysE family transporter [Methanomassiliicoccales archaeon]